MVGCGAIFDPPKLTSDIAALEERMQASDFWDDQEAASKVSAEYSRLKRRLEEFEALEGRFADLETTEELVREELAADTVDDDLLDELVAGVDALERELQHGEEQRFFSGRFDEGGAIVTIPRAPAAPSRRTGRRCCCACTCAGPNAADSRWR